MGYDSPRVGYDELPQWEMTPTVLEGVKVSPCGETLPGWGGMIPPGGKQLG